MTRVFRSALLLTSVALLAQVLSARTIIVDGSGGPGTNYLDLPPAVAAAVDGDVLLVRAGRYTGFRTSKGISVIGEANALIATDAGNLTAVRVIGLGPGKTFAMSGFRVQLLGLVSTCSVENCQGTVCFENMWFLNSILLFNSTDVRLTACQSGSLEIQQSHASLDRCLVRASTPSPYVAFPGIGALNSSLVLSRCEVYGGAIAIPIGYEQSGPALLLGASTAILTGDGTGAIQAGRAGSSAAPAIEGTGTVSLDPHVAIQGYYGGPVAAPGITLTMRSIPSLRTTGAPPGGSVAVELFGPAGDLYFVLLGLPAAPIPYPSLGGSLWFHSPLLARQGVQNATMRATLDVLLPNSPVLTGLSFTWQALAGPDLARLALSNPSSYTHPN